ncbi:50S ribosomal protein L24 [Rosistilla ulvae]|uniref:Large ribosomal subunit protein uL24 n=1 Tax=Rosistilla ulvae TaxID=1930277 RepID=A0A517M6S5_9BACT|nr:50S ribosomal protein L24 [Rosistilla ulvae]QDS90578.1 50S ribosomal protein L24 [Rosistilla ulvae]
MLIKVDDNVKVIAGADKGTTGKVLKVDHKKNKVLVEGVARVWKHVRKSQKNPQGGRLNKEMPIAISNVMIVCPQTGKPSRIGVRYLKDGTKERYAKVSGASLGAMSPPRPAYAS